MIVRRHIAALLLAFALLFAQGLASAHVANYGDAPHDHDGVTCAVALVAEDADNLLPPPPAPVPFTPRPAARLWHTDFLSAPVRLPSARAPPPRAPPL